MGDESVELDLLQRAITECCPRSCVWEVSTGSDAVAFLRHKPPFMNLPSPSLILLAVHAPGLTGRTILSELQRLAEYQQTSVIVISERDKGSEESRYLQLGTTAYVQKATDVDTYFERIKTTVRECVRTRCPS